MDYILKDARTNKDLYIDTFIEYCNCLAIEDPSIKNYDYTDLALENLESNLDHPFLVFIDNSVAGLVVFSDADDIKDESSCYTYINELFIKEKYRNNGIASRIFLNYLKELKHDTGFCYVVNSKAELLWKKLLDTNGYKYDIYKEDDIRDFIHIHV